jgi:hypothetical protein
VAEPHWFQRHTALTVTVCALLGAAIGMGYALTIPSPDSYFFLEPIQPAMALVTTAVGMLFGLLLGILLVRDRGMECPRCGTRNEEGTVECSACGLSLS